MVVTVYENTYGSHLKLDGVKERLADNFCEFMNQNLVDEIPHATELLDDPFDMTWVLEDGSQYEVVVIENHEFTDEWKASVYQVL